MNFPLKMTHKMMTNKMLKNNLKSFKTLSKISVKLIKSRNKYLKI